MRYTACLSAAILMVGLTALAPVAEAGEKESRETCCFTNPRYTGICTVKPGENETCASILAYLNNQQSAGKAYCSNTPIRGGWASVDCGAKSMSNAGAAAVCAAESAPSDENSAVSHVGVLSSSE